MEPFRKAELYLRRRLEKTECGERVTTVRECMKECQVSKAVVDRAAVFLQGERLLEIRPRSGLYKPAAETAEKNGVYKTALIVVGHCLAGEYELSHL